LKRSFGPFEPPKKLEIPLWAALALKGEKQCKIFSPEYLTTGKFLFNFDISIMVFF
jgi:hypothetical protein